MGQSKSLLIDSKFNYQILKAWHPTKKLVSVAILAVFTAILQSVGGILPGIGLMVSPFSTITILLAAMISFQHGLFTYLLTIPLLLLLEPSELFIFPYASVCPWNPLYNFIRVGRHTKGLIGTGSYLSVRETFKEGWAFKIFSP